MAMAARTRSRGRPQGFSMRFWSMLSYASGELGVIVLLYVAAAASYSAARLARAFGLRAPCTLCSSLELSSLACCKTHRKLVGDARSSLSRSRPSSSCCSEPPKRSEAAAMPLPSLSPSPSSEQAPADHPKEKPSEPDGSPRTDERSANKDSANASGGAAANKPMRVFVNRKSSTKNGFIGRAVNLPSPRPSEIISARDSNSTTQQEVKAFLSQMSSARGLDTSAFCTTEGPPTPGPGAQTEEVAVRKLERNSSALDPSSDGSNADEAAEGEGSPDPESLKKQLDLNRKAMGALYRELEEERSASAVAASQAMAMINRLHEEKAAMQMEALQYLRMMEEQADHDHEAIQNLHDLLTDREKELLDMDAELESCRRLLQVQDAKLDAARAGPPYAAFDVSDNFVGSTMLGFQDEKAYVLDSLSGLEEKVHSFTDKLASVDATDR